jgi:hypothetical protein
VNVISHLCSKSAVVTTRSFSLHPSPSAQIIPQTDSWETTNRIGPKTGFEARTTTAFCTVDRVTSGPLTRRLLAAICWLHLCDDGVLLPCWDSGDVFGLLRDSEYSRGAWTGLDEVEVGVVLRALSLIVLQMGIRRGREKCTHHMSSIRQSEERQDLHHLFVIKNLPPRILNPWADLNKSLPGLKDLRTKE